MPSRTWSGLAVLGLMIIAGATLLHRGAAVATAQETPVQMSPQPPKTPPIGAACTIQFRRDALGLADRMLVPHYSTSLGESDLTLKGFFVSMDAHWLVMTRIKDEDRYIWIPRENVLLLDFAVE